MCVLGDSDNASDRCLRYITHWSQLQHKICVTYKYFLFKEGHILCWNIFWNFFPPPSNLTPTEPGGSVYLQELVTRDGLPLLWHLCQTPWSHSGKEFHKLITHLYIRRAEVVLSPVFSQPLLRYVPPVWESAHPAFQIPIINVAVCWTETVGWSIAAPLDNEGQHLISSVPFIRF